MRFTPLEGFSLINAEAHLWSDSLWSRATECSKVGKRVGFSRSADCPSALVRDGKLARLFFFFLSSLPSAEKGRKGPRWWYSIERVAPRSRERGAGWSGRGGEARRARLHRAFPFTGYPSIPLSAVLVTQSKLSPSRLTFPHPSRSGKIRRIRTRFFDTLQKSRILWICNDRRKCHLINFSWIRSYVVFRNKSGRREKNIYIFYFYF